MSLVTFFTPPSLSTIRLMGQTIEELLGVGSRIALRINEDFALNNLHLIEIIVGPEVGPLIYFALTTFTLKKFDCMLMFN